MKGQYEIPLVDLQEIVLLFNKKLAFIKKQQQKKSSLIRYERSEYTWIL